MKLVCLSDTHGNLPDIEPCDLLLIGGDICPATNHEILFQKKWLDTEFRRWLNKVPAKNIVGVCGNHDFIFEDDCHRIPKGLNWDYLQERTVKTQGLNIWGSPWQSWFYNWAFNAPRNDLDEVFLDKIYSKIPDDTDIIISHGPPAECGGVDMVPPGLQSFNAGNHVGSKSLFKHLLRVKPKLVVTGHIHSGRIHSPFFLEYGDDTVGTIVNASFIDENYRPAFTPLAFEWSEILERYNAGKKADHGPQ